MAREYRDVLFMVTLDTSPFVIVLITDQP